MNLQQIEYIVALDRFKSFSKAADACFITQATLSTMVKKLEEELDMVIFDRKTNPIITTDCGKEIIDEAKKILQTDPAIKNGLLGYEIFSWYGSAALSEYLPFSDKIWKLKP